MAAARRCHRGCLSLVLVTLSVAFTARGATGLRPRSPLKTNATMRSLVEAPADRRRLAAYNIVEVDKLTADAAAAGDSFGWSVAFDSGTVVVGAHSDNDACTDNPLCNSGAAYVYSLGDAGLVYTKLTAPDAAADDYFGVSVAIDGETIVVGAYAKNFGTGAAYVYRASDDGATHDHVAKLTSPGAMGDAFGISVAVDGAAVVVGAGQWLNLGSGSAYVYEEIPQKTASSSQSAYNLTSDAARSLPAAATLLAAGAALAF